MGVFSLFVVHMVHVLDGVGGRLSYLQLVMQHTCVEVEVRGMGVGGGGCFAERTAYPLVLI